MCLSQSLLNELASDSDPPSPQVESHPVNEDSITEELENGSSIPNLSSRAEVSEAVSSSNDARPPQNKLTSLAHLPSEIIMMIGGFLRPRDLQKFLLCCIRFSQILGRDLNMLACKDKKLSTKALFYAAAHRNYDLVKILLERGTGITVMEYAREVTAIRGVGKWRYEIIHETPDDCYEELFDFVLSEGKNLVLMWNKKAYTALHWAIKTEDKLLTSLLLTKGASTLFRTDYREGTGPLHIAACKYGFNMTYFLLSKGFPVDQHDAENHTALQAVLRHQKDNVSCKSIVMLLLEKGASVTVRNKWLMTPLHHIVSFENWASLIPVIVALGADVNARNRWGATPLHIAAKLGNVQVVNELLVAGADVNIVNDQERTAWGLAMAYRRSDVACILSMIGGSVED
ncbi:ankyrin [Morchella conica CCBAS932]|uniref:Ankyrin n=1 Tax=Morchella conica CCBAS932 TaxID=1392247 RepID=A0A3N4L2N8_9PEZI|nr:ankyrin [Morchella conica CCBAS932]